MFKYPSAWQSPHQASQAGVTKLLWILFSVCVLTAMAKHAQAAVEQVATLSGGNKYIWYAFDPSVYPQLTKSDPLSACQAVNSVFGTTWANMSVADNGIYTSAYPYLHQFLCSGTESLDRPFTIIINPVIPPVTAICPITTPPYTFNPATNFCERTIEQYTISLSGLGGEIMPNATRSAYAQVINNSDGLPKSGAQVALSLTVVPDSGAPTLPPNVGSLSPNGGLTGVDGRLPFVFTAPSASGTHTITATCTNCTNVATDTIKVPSCPILDLPLITDPDVLAFEANSDLSDQARLDPTMQTALVCLLRDAAAGSPTVGSAYRPPAYNNHLIAVWEKWIELTKQDNLACVPLKSKIQQHFQRHGLIETQGPVLNSRHTRGLAVDVTINLPSANIDALAAGCGLRRPLPVRDRVHFQFP